MSEFVIAEQERWPGWWRVYEDNELILDSTRRHVGLALIESIAGPGDVVTERGRDGSERQRSGWDFKWDRLGDKFDALAAQA